MTLPKAILIFSLLTTCLTKADVIDGRCPNSIGEWIDWYISELNRQVANGYMSTEFDWGPRTVRGKSNWISAYSENGRRLADILLPASLRARVHDWEAIAVNRENGTNFIYLADIGDKKSSQTIYKFKEPRVSHSWRGHNIPIRTRDIERIRVKSSVHVRDCKAMVVDPLNGDILLFTKKIKGHVSKVYKVPQDSGDSKSKSRSPKYVTTLPMLVTEAEILPTGDILAMNNNEEEGSMTKSCGLMAWADFLKTRPALCRLNSKQVEEELEAIWGGSRDSSRGGSRGSSRRTSRGGFRGSLRSSSRGHSRSRS